jgi:metallo-beta-lactamase class B
MKRLIKGGAVGLAAVLGLCSPCWSEDAPSSETVAAHIAAATKAANGDLQSLMPLCKAPPAGKPSQEETDKLLEKLINQPRPQPGKAFDNLYYVGAKWVSAWAIKTSDGIILIDSLNNADEAKDLIDGGLRKLGMDPAQIKYVIITHGHGDHYGGATWLAEHYHPRIAMSEADWKMTETKLEFTSSLWGPPPKRDMVISDGEPIRLGDTTVTLYLTPGHTMGTLSAVFDVRDGATVYHAVLWGGTAFNFGKDIPRLQSYIQSTERMQTLVKDQGIDVMLSNHSQYDESLKKLDEVRAKPEPNPFVMGTPAVERALTVMNECARAARDRFEMQP